MENKRIDFNLIIGFLLIGLLLYLMNNSLMSNSSTDADSVDTTKIDNLENKNSNVSDSTLIDFDINNKSELGEINKISPPLSNKTEPIFSTLKSEKLNLKFSNICGCFIDASLIEKEDGNNYKYEYTEGVPVKLINEDISNNFPLDIGVNSKFNLIQLDTINNKIIYQDSISKLELIYELKNDHLKLSINNINEDEFKIGWNIKGPRQEKNLNSGWTSERTQSDLYYAYADGGYDYISNPDDPETEENISWVAYKQQFFSTIVHSKNKSFEAQKMSVNFNENDDSYVKEMKSNLIFELEKNKSLSLDFYFLPNDYTYLKSFDTGESDSYDNLVPLGWGIFGWVNQYLVIPVFDMLESFGLGYGLIILAIAVIFKMLLFFPTKKSYVSMAKMRVLKPEIDALNEKYKDKDPMEKQRAQMDLYKRTGVSPLGGCLPMLFQIPILFALFKFFPASIQLRQEAFLWANDLSTYDTWPFGEFGLIPGWFDHLSLFALLMSISTLVQMRFNAQPSNSQMPQLKYIMYIMPVVFFFIMNSYSSGLSYYYLCANIMTFLQQLYIKRNLNDEELYKQLQENKKKPVKKSGFQKRLEEMAKKQQEARRRK